MQVRYEKDNKERIPFEHYLEEFAAIDPKEAAARVGVPWHEETQEFEVRMMQKAFLVKWPECTIRKANPFDEGYGAMENGVPPKIMVIRFLTRGVYSEGTGKFLTYREVPHGEVYYRQFNGRCMMRLAFSYGNTSLNLSTGIAYSFCCGQEMRNFHHPPRFCFQTISRCPLKQKTWQLSGILRSGH